MTETRKDIMYMDIEADSLKGRFLTFMHGNEYFGIEIKNVTEIINMQPITDLPDTPEYVKGIINLRGNIVPIIDMGLRFKKETIKYTNKTCIIVLNINDTSIGIIVDYVKEVLYIQENNIVETPHLTNNFNNRFIKNIGKVGNDIILILDSKKILTEDELEYLTEIL